MTALRFPASLEGVILGAIKQVLDDHDRGLLPEFAYDRTAEGEMEVTFLAVDHAQPESHPAFDLMEGLGDERPEGASGVAEEDDEQPQGQGKVA